MKKILILCFVAAGLTSPQVFAFGSPCSLLGDHALMFAQWRNSGQPYSEVDKYFRGQGDGKLIRMQRTIAEDIYNKQPNTLTPGAWQALAIKVCQQQYGH